MALTPYKLTCLFVTPAMLEHWHAARTYYLLKGGVQATNSHCEIVLSLLRVRAWHLVHIHASSFSVQGRSTGAKHQESHARTQHCVACRVYRTTHVVQTTQNRRTIQLAAHAVQRNEMQLHLSRRPSRRTQIFEIFGPLFVPDLCGQHSDKTS